MKNNKLLIISFILLFNLSCDDNEYPTQIYNSDESFELTLNMSLDGGEDDLATFAITSNMFDEAGYPTDGGRLQINAPLATVVEEH